MQESPDLQKLIKTHGIIPRKLLPWQLAYETTPTILSKITFCQTISHKKFIWILPNFLWRLNFKSSVVIILRDMLSWLRIIRAWFTWLQHSSVSLTPQLVFLTFSTDAWCSMNTGWENEIMVQSFCDQWTQDESLSLRSKPVSIKCRLCLMFLTYIWDLSFRSGFFPGELAHLFFHY